ncbi:hypothetical protein PUNSTDRAFT_74600 [Punctularia strigosozonata HHB-11173 SS5]|uniref:uncharacterized protein n=1 Tax=Punctularia strigosozonata (strain HHB-11173) TaxID=741275 RepID=UPI0004417596|nr:uncharacterized protein PUNSTDRAFT_74600 [Punctularia strigosozonata HHB-11173 SS5]EIN05430.1 hypothetical protein PUNSTDRAFT_74600 [Punctularia strigosozonata HHB-11173 SS5]
MPRITANPHEQVAPNFAGAAFAACRRSLVNQDGLTDEQAAQTLLDAWTADINLEKAAWDRQIAADQEAAQLAEQERLDREATEKAEEEREAAKNRPKIPTYTKGHMVGQESAPLTDIKALKKLKAYQYVELWYFGVEGRRRAAEDACRTSDEVLIVAWEGEGGALRQSAPNRLARFCVPDRDLTWRELSIAKTGLLEDMAKVGWPKNIVQDFVDFFFAIDNHPSRYEGPHGDPCLLLYQEEVRQLWHFRYDRNPAEVFDPSVFNNDRLQRITQRYLNTQVSSINNAYVLPFFPHFRNTAR